MNEPKYQKSIQALEIIASELKLPESASLSDVLTTFYKIDEDGEAMNLFIKVVSKEICEKILKNIA